MGWGLLLLGIVWGSALAFDGHGGDYAWRSQRVILFYQTPAVVAGAVTTALVALKLRRVRQLGDARRWAVALRFVVAAMVVWMTAVYRLDHVVLSWDANVPPANWDEVSNWRAVTTTVGVVLWIVALVKISLATRERKERPAATL